MYQNQHINDFLNDEEISVIHNGFKTFNRLHSEWRGYQSKIYELQTSGHWFKDEVGFHRDDTVFYYEYVHLDAALYDDTGKYVKQDRPDGSSDFIKWMKDIKSQFDIKEFHYYMTNLIQKKFPDQVLRWIALYDLPFLFSTHTDGRDVKNKRDPRPEKWSDLKRSDWFIEEGWEYTYQGLINIDVENPDDGTVIFDQTFPYSTYLDFSIPPEEPGRFGQKFSKQMIRFAKGDEIQRFDAEIGNFTHQPMSDEDYLWITNNEQYNKNLWPQEAGYGLTVDDILTFDMPGTMYSWDSSKYHIVKPMKKGDDLEAKNRLTLSFVLGQYIK